MTIFSSSDEYRKYNRFTDAADVCSELMEVFKADINTDTDIKDFDAININYYCKALNLYGRIMEAQNRFADAEYYYKKDLVITTKLAAAYPEDPGYKRALTISLANVADIKKAKNDLSGALTLYEEDLQISRELADAFPENPGYKRDLFVSWFNLSGVYATREDYKNSLKCVETALLISEDLCAQFPQSIQYLSDLSAILKLRSLFASLYDGEEAAQSYLARKEEIDRRIAGLSGKL